MHRINISSLRSAAYREHREADADIDAKTAAGVLYVFEQCYLCCAVSMCGLAGGDIRCNKHAPQSMSRTCTADIKQRIRICKTQCVRMASAHLLTLAQPALRQQVHHWYAQSWCAPWIAFVCVVRWSCRFRYHRSFTYTRNNSKRVP